DIVALAHGLGRIVGLPEDAQQLVVRDLGRIEDHADGLGVARATRADLLVRGVGGVAALVADGSGPDPGHLPERLLLAPEAAERELSHLEAGGIGARDRGA